MLNEKKYKTINNKYQRMVRKTGLFQSIVGMFIIIIFIVFSFICNKYEENIINNRLNSKEKTKLRIKFTNEPPGIEIFRKILSPAITEEQKYTYKQPELAEVFEMPQDNKEKTTYHQFHLLGTDQNGDDILTNIMKGTRTALLGSALAIFISLLIGLPAGIISGYFSGAISNSIDYFVSLISTIPKLVFLVIIIATLGFDFVVIMGTIGFLGSAKIKDIVQSKINQFKENQFIEAARELGISDYKIIFKHILWYNCKTIIFVQSSFLIAEVILLEVSLSYIGLGVRDQVSWGSMLSNGMEFLNNQQYWMLFFPAVFIVLAIFSFIITGKGFNKLLNLRGS